MSYISRLTLPVTTPWLMVKNGRVVGMRGWQRATVDSLLARQAMMRCMPIAEVHRAFIHYAERYGEPVGEPTEHVFHEWARVA